MKKRVYKLISIIISIIILISIYYLYLSKKGIVIPCLFYEVTGLYCPGCGLTRMLFSIIRLDFYQAFRYNPLIFIAMPFIILYLIDFIFKWIIGKENYWYKKINNKTWTILLIITLLFGLLRNLPIFNYLIPTMV